MGEGAGVYLGGLNLIRRAIFGRWVLRKFRQLLPCFAYSGPEGCTAGTYFLSSTEKSLKPIIEVAIDSINQVMDSIR